MSQPEIKPTLEKADKKELDAFLEEYKIICKRYGLMIAGQLKYGKNGISIEPIIVKQDDKS